MTGPALLVLDTALRGGAVALYVVVAAVALREARGRPAALLAAALALGAAAYATCSAPQHLVEHGALWFAPVIALCTGNAAVFWLFTRAAFDDGFRPAPKHAAVWMALTVYPLAHWFGLLPANEWIAGGQRLIVVGLALLATAQTVKDWRGDLVEGRRRLRLFIVVATAAHIAATIAAEFAFAPTGRSEAVPPALHLLNAASLAAIALTIAVLLFSADLDPILARGPTAPRAAAGGPVSDAPAATAIESAREEPVDPALLGALEKLMTVDRLYRQEGLTIGALAARLGVPEYRLRRTINRGLGYRNFNDYLNRHRLADAKQALADSSQAEVPILTVALDAGFQSLGPFNRAFKADVGMTPTEFRRARSAGKIADS